ncbi:hypothetical protein [Frigoriglobus tundricola]|uniref:Uncharacterized protein n=1 Tax=Frigoriglobus tundricola TaxID=2774151 RepID=A0A6M5YUL6_9BACT|nr:hypothetical protein [Frigoriglobus tundricola]QJW97609.1 hypothetical protein FTUN_5184 [Frigoriglobus tundricola]
MPARPEGTVWVLRFTRPLAGAAVLETTAAGPPVGAAGAALPVPQLLGARQTARAVAAPAIADATAAKLTDDAVRPEPLPGRTEGLDAGAIQDAYLVTAVRAPGEALAAFGGTVRDTRGGGAAGRAPAGHERARGVRGRALVEPVRVRRPRPGGARSGCRYRPGRRSGSKCGTG